MMTDDASEQENRAAIYRESADKLRQLAAEVRFDFGRREQLLALAAAFDRLAARMEQSALTLIAERAEPLAAVVLSRRCSELPLKRRHALQGYRSLLPTRAQGGHDSENRKPDE